MFEIGLSRPLMRNSTRNKRSKVPPDRLIRAIFATVIVVALTGGIGAGKSSVSRRLTDRGAVVIDADQIVKELQRPGEPVFDAMVARWGQGILSDDGGLDRQAVAAIVFADADELRALNELVHPAVRSAMTARLDELAAVAGVVVLDIPLLAEGDAQKRGASAVIVVDCPIELAIDRLVESRGFDRVDAESRVAAQATREERLALADFVIDNSGDERALDVEVDRCMSWLSTLDQTPWPKNLPESDET